MIISFFLTPVRFLLELPGLPEHTISLIGLLWLTLAFSVFWGIKLQDQKQPYLLILISLAISSPILRLTVFAAWWYDIKWNIGTHYSLYFNNWPQALLNQVVYGSLVQIIPGIVLGSATMAIMRHRSSAQKLTECSGELMTFFIEKTTYNI